METPRKEIFSLIHQAHKAPSFYYEHLLKSIKKFFFAPRNFSSIINMYEGNDDDNFCLPKTQQGFLGRLWANFCIRRWLCFKGVGYKTITSMTIKRLFLLWASVEKRLKKLFFAPRNFSSIINMQKEPMTIIFVCPKLNKVFWGTCGRIFVLVDDFALKGLCTKPSLNRPPVDHENRLGNRLWI